MTTLRSRIGVAGLGSLALALFVAVLVMTRLFPLTSDMPHWDQWSMVEVFQAHYAGQPVLPLLLTNYNGHYNCLARFLFYGLGLASRWDTRLEALVGFFWASCTLAVLLRMLWEASPRLLVLAAPFAAWVFSVLQFANLVNGWGMGQLLAAFAAILTLYLLTDPHAGRWRFSLAVVSAAAAILSHGAGIGVAPAGLMALLLIGSSRKWPRIAVFGLVAGAGVGLGMVGGRDVELVVLWRRLPAFVVTVLGRPFSWDLGATPRSTAILGALMLLSLVAVLAWRVAREWASRRDLLVRWGCLALLSVAVAVLISVRHSEGPLQVAMGTHYVTSTYPLGLALMVLTADRLHRSTSHAAGARKLLFGAALAACCVVPALQQGVVAYRIVPMLRSWERTGRLVSLRLAAGTATDQEILVSMHPLIDLVREGVEVLRSQRLAWFAHAREASHPFGGLDRVAGRPPASTVKLPEGTAWVFEGWVLPPILAPETPVEAVLIVDGAIVSREQPRRPRTDIEARYGSRAFLKSGFALIAPDGGLRPPGRYRVRVAARDARWTVTLRRLELVVLPR